MLKTTFTPCPDSVGVSHIPTFSHLKSLSVSTPYPRRGFARVRDVVGRQPFEAPPESAGRSRATALRSSARVCEARSTRATLRQFKIARFGRPSKFRPSLRGPERSRATFRQSKIQISKSKIPPPPPLARFSIVRYDLQDLPRGAIGSTPHSECGCSRFES